MFFTRNHPCSLNTIFIRNIITLVTGNAIAFIVPVILYPVLSRVFSPADYALFGLYISIFTFLEIASAGRYDFAVVLPESDEAASSIVAGGFLISLAYSSVILVLVSIVGTQVAFYLNNADLASWLYLLPLALLFISISKLSNAWLVRQKRFKGVSINKASHKVAETSSQLILGFTATSGGLLVGDVVGRFFNAVFSIYQGWRAGLSRARFKTSSIKTKLKEYSDFPRFSILPSMLNTLGAMLPVFLISSYYSTQVSGSFNFSRIVLSIPVALISSGISQVLMQQVTERKHRKEAIWPELSSLGTKMIVLSVAMVIPLYFAGPELFALVFGAEWREAGAYTGILIFATAVSLIVSPFSVLLLVLGKIRLLSYWQIAYFFASAMLWFLSDTSINTFLLAIVVIDVISYLAYAALIYSAVRNYEKHLHANTY